MVELEVLDNGMPIMLARGLLDDGLGWGRELGEEGFLAFTEQQSVSIQLRGS
jgi:hypothetical protein